MGQHASVPKVSKESKTLPRTKKTTVTNDSYYTTYTAVDQKTLMKDAATTMLRTKPPKHILLYGPGESGKTTIQRQFSAMYGHDLTKEAKRFRGYICFNVIEGAALAIKAAKTKLNITFTSDEAIAAALNIEELFDQISASGTLSNATLDNDIVKAIKTLSIDPGFIECLRRKSEYQIHDGWEYYYEKLLDEYPIWGGKHWQPDKLDLLNARIRTVGDVVTEFESDGNNYRVIDIGGQRNERRKLSRWLTQVKCIVFVVSLSEYDQMLYEDGNESRLRESVKLWRKTVNDPALKDAFFVLLLNKFDLFQKKYFDEGIPIRLPFKYSRAPPERNDEHDRLCERALRWYEQLFMSKVQDEEQRDENIRVYVTSALDDEDMQKSLKMITKSLVRHEESKKKKSIL